MFGIRRALALSHRAAPVSARAFLPATGRSSPLRRGLLALAVLAGCTQMQSDDAETGIYRFFNSQRNPGMETLENTVEYTLVPATRAMIYVPDALLVLERNLGGAVEQRIVLPNATAVRGDNLVLIRAQNARSARLDQFSMDEIATRFGGLPAPFTQLNEGALNSGTDPLGSFVYASETLGTNTVCVLVMRRMGVGARPLPQGASALDVIMRNCVNGTVQEALAPTSARALAVSGTPGASNSLSPYAAPGG